MLFRSEEVAIDAIRPGDRLLIRQGDIVPVDGRVSNGRALLDMAALTVLGFGAAFLLGRPRWSGR